MKRRVPSGGRRVGGVGVKKRTVPAVTADSEDEDGFGVDDLPSDTLAAVKYQCRKFRSRFPTRISMTFVHHLYQVVKDRSMVDQELQACREEKALRLLFVNSGPADRGIVIESEYLEMVQEIANELERENKVLEASVVRSFHTNILPVYNDLSISVKDLRAFIFGVTEEDEIYQKVNNTLPVESILSDAGLLIRRVDIYEANSYWITMPLLGEVVGLIKEGRKAIIAQIKKKRNKQLLLRDLRAQTVAKPSGKSQGILVKRTLPKGSSNAQLSKAIEVMGLDFHVMDALQSETDPVVVIISTSSCIWFTRTNFPKTAKLSIEQPDSSSNRSLIILDHATLQRPF